MSAPLPDVAGAVDFREAAGRVLAYLREALPMTFWSVTRVENGRQSYLYLNEDNGYGLTQGESHPWQASFCVHMVTGAAPAIAPNAQAVPAYAQAAVNDAITIGTYAGAPVWDADGSLFGALCGLDRHARSDDQELVAAGPVLALLGQLLTSALAMERSRDSALRLIAQVQAEADTDTPTSLPNRRGWDRRVQEAMPVIQRLGDPTVVVMVDLDRLKQVNDTFGHAAGDDHIRHGALALAAAVREGDLVARLGGDEFAVLLRQCTECQGEDIVARITDRLDGANVAASIGWAPVTITGGLPEAMRAADAAMYENKQTRREHPPGHPSTERDEPTRPGRRLLPEICS